MDKFNINHDIAAIIHRTPGNRERKQGVSIRRVIYLFASRRDFTSCGTTVSCLLVEIYEKEKKRSV